MKNNTRHVARVRFGSRAKIVPVLAARIYQDQRCKGQDEFLRENAAGGLRYLWKTNDFRRVVLCRKRTSRRALLDTIFANIVEKSARKLRLM